MAEADVILALNTNTTAIEELTLVVTSLAIEEASLILTMQALTSVINTATSVNNTLKNCLCG